MKSLSIHILTTHLNKHRQESVLKTWLSNFEDYIFNTDFNTSVGNQIEMTTRSDHASNAIKHVFEYDRIHKNKLYENFEWFYFCDDDTAPNTPRILNYIKTADNTKIHAYSMHSWATDTSLLSISGGAGYLVPSNLFKLTPPKYREDVPWADVQFALWLRENKIPIQHSEEFKQDTPKSFGIDVEKKEDRNLIRDHMSFHYITDDNLREKLWEIYTTPKE